MAEHAVGDTSEAPRCRTIRSCVLVVMCTYRGNHEALVIASKWLRNLPHIIYSDAPLNATGHGSLGLNVEVGPDMLHLGEPGRDFLFHRPSDMRQAAVVEWANTTYAGTFRWIAPRYIHWLTA
jgi:hypothetical protein